jgi:flagellar biosynthesis protein FlhF
MKKYQAGSIDEAMAAIRADLGPNAMIVHQSEVKRGPLGLLSKPRIEVVAAVDDAPTRAPAPARPAPRPAARATTPAPRQRPAAAPPPKQRPAAVPRPFESERGVALEAALRALAEGQKPVEAGALREMQQHVAELRGAIGEMMRHAQWPGLAKLAPPLADLHQRLLEQEVEQPLAQELITAIDGELSLQAANDPATVLACLGKHLRAMLPVAGPLRPTPGQPTVLFLIGPTGVGKTTTIAKLAATVAMRRHSVALITCDTYRIAAIPQLRTYADILRVPIEVAYTPDELTTHVMNHIDKDFIIVDTPGRSQRNADQLADLRKFVLAVPCRTTYLTVTAGTRYRDMLDIVERFGTVPFDGLLVTKLDETSTFGPMLNLVRQTGKPITYLTDGQNVPHDITVATSSDLADMLVRSAYERAPAAAGSVA